MTVSTPMTAPGSWRATWRRSTPAGRSSSSTACVGTTGRGRPFEEVDGSFGGFIGACYDVTERFETIERLQAAQDAQTLLLQTALHDIASPLTSAIAAVEMLRERPDQDPVTVLEVAERQLVRMQKVLDGLRELDRARHGPLRARAVGFSLRQMAEEVVAVTVSDERELRMDVQEGEVRLDPIMTERILENLLANAVRHTPAGTTIEVQATVEDDVVVLVVEDDGPGIDELEGIFEPYMRAVHAGGIGLGLSLVTRYAEAHGGQVVARDRHPHGAVFEVRLPQGDPEGADRDTDRPSAR